MSLVVEKARTRHILISSDGRDTAIYRVGPNDVILDVWEGSYLQTRETLDLPTARKRYRWMRGEMRMREW